MADAAINAFAGTGKPYIEISGLWVYGANSSISEESPFDPPAMVSWREPIERRVLGASGMRGIVIVSGVAYGDGAGGIPGLLLGSPRDNAGNLIMLGPGRQHWATVHVADLADFFRRVLEHDSARGYYVIGDGLNPTAAELTERSRRSGSCPGFRRRGSGTPGRLLRRSPTARPGHCGGEGAEPSSIGTPRAQDPSTSSATGATRPLRRGAERLTATERT